jgi:multiple sugar transport system permease protein
MGAKLLFGGMKVFFLGGFLLWTVVPIALVISNSFKTAVDIFSVPPTVFFVPTLENYVRALTSGDFGRYFLNSLFVSTISSVLSVGFGALAAYSLVSLRPKYAIRIANMLLLGKLVPAITILLPLFAMINLTGLLGTFVGPILAHTSINLPFVIWLVMGFIQDLPEDLQSAAKIDGCTRMQVFWLIVSPLIMPDSRLQQYCRCNIPGTSCYFRSSSPTWTLTPYQSGFRSSSDLFRWTGERVAPRRQ